MECGGCNLIELAPVELDTGTVVCTSCPCWRLECEAREVLAKPLEKRREYLDDIEKIRGAAAADELRNAMTIVWEKRRAA